MRVANVVNIVGENAILQDIAPVDGALLDSGKKRDPSSIISLREIGRLTIVKISASSIPEAITQLK